MEAYVGSGDIAPRNFNLRARRKWSESKFTSHRDGMVKDFIMI